MEQEGMMDELKPCPWCGKAPTVERLLWLYMVSCVNPGCPVMPHTTFCRTRARAIRLWNRREREHD